MRQTDTLIVNTVRYLFFIVLFLVLVVALDALTVVIASWVASHGIISSLITLSIIGGFFVLIGLQIIDGVTNWIYNRSYSRKLTAITAKIIAGINLMLYLLTMGQMYINNDQSFSFCAVGIVLTGLFTWYVLVSSTHWSRQTTTYRDASTIMVEKL